MSQLPTGQKEAISNQTITEQLSNEDEELPSSSTAVTSQLSTETESLEPTAMTEQKHSTLESDIEVPNSTTPINRPSLPKEKSPYKSERFEDVFEEIIMALTDVTSFTKFARARNGLCLGENEIEEIQYNQTSAQEKKIKMLWKWKELEGEKASTSRIWEILQKYLKKQRGENEPTAERSVVPNEGQQQSNMTEDQALLREEILDRPPSTTHEERFEDVFEEIIMAFTDILSFTKFARARKGLCLGENEIEEIQYNQNSAQDKKIKMLWKWKELEGEKASTSQIRAILQEYKKKQRFKNEPTEEPPVPQTTRQCLATSQGQQLLKRHEHPGVQQKEISDMPDSTADEANTIIIFNLSDQHLHSYEPVEKNVNGKWKKLQKFKDGEKQFTTARLQEFIYKFCEKEVEKLKYQDLKAEWSPVANMREDHGKLPAAVAFKDSMYVCGDSLKTKASPCIEKYDSSENGWECKPNRKTARCTPCVVGGKDRIYCIGIKNTEGDGTIEKIFGAEWKYINPTENQNSVICATMLQDLIYVVCGVADNIAVWCYDTNDSKWQKISANRWPFGTDAKILTVNEKLYLLGKQTSNSKYAIYLLDPTTKNMTLIEEIVGKEIIVPASVTAYF